VTFPYVFAWGNNPRRTELKGRRCRILARGLVVRFRGKRWGTRSVLAEFENGERVVCSARALRRT
jgi:hypothetical protein